MKKKLIVSLLFVVTICVSQVVADERAVVELAVDKVRVDDGQLLAGIPGDGPLTKAQIQSWLTDKNNHRPIEFVLPEAYKAGKANVFVPKDNPITRAKIELGRQLYFDERLSSDGSISCASCHVPTEGFAANTRFGVGVDGQTGDRNSPVVFNRLFSKEQFWDGRAKSLEDQAVGPIANAIEMANTHEACVECVEQIEGYQLQFKAIFKDGVSIENIGKAIATFERAIVTGAAPYDYYQAKMNFEKLFADDLDYLDEEPELEAEYDKLRANVKKYAMSESAVRGMDLFFNKGKCNACHIGVNFTDELYHNLGVGMEAKKPDLGRFKVTGKEADKGAFKTPTLRNVVHSPPYMHDGSQATLAEVVDWYNKGGHPNPWLSDKVPKLDLTDQEKADLVAFMKDGLTGSFPKIETGRLPTDD
jgi:cytochrome c peroxidase